ncbi:AI-2E family transporter [Georgenia yuyongxinii]|uniref:AI-2E family transporter n=1 Tax=Georgenia yuyongxinii TaxID=2589797 RepID=A0A552WWG0_9MICO|nr:AI-2E family transporter [Georgenia yuyongxinii]TRW47112.1 AI-2E family transporter [Georgenia yuyongxinii]
MTSPTPVDLPERAPTPGIVRTILTTIGLLLATALLLYIVVESKRVLTWMVIAAFFAVALYPVVNWVQDRLLGHRRRVLATLLVFVVVLLVLAAIVAVFAVPVAREGAEFAGQLPHLIDEARAGRGPVGDLLARTNALEYVQNNQERIRSFATGLTSPAAGALRSVATGIVGLLTIFVLAFLMILEGPKVVEGFVGLFQPRTGRRIRAVGGDCAKSVTGYLSGNLLISVICGVLAYAVLKISGVPFAGLIALFVALADLIPLVGATLGAVVATVAALIHSVPAAIAVVVFFLIYQQLENHLLQPVILSRTVKLNPLTVIVAILLAVELAGILGAFLAIPVASMVQVIARDVWDHRRGRPKVEPTVGEERQPVSRAPHDAAIAGEAAPPHV